MQTKDNRYIPVFFKSMSIYVAFVTKIIWNVSHDISGLGLKIFLKNQTGIYVFKFISAKEKNVLWSRNIWKFEKYG